jgi:hypothetical protein
MWWGKGDDVGSNYGPIVVIYGRKQRRWYISGKIRTQKGRN